MSKNNSITIGVKVIAPPTIIAHSDDHARNMWEMRVERERKSGNATDYFAVRFNGSDCPLLTTNDNDSSRRSIKTGDIVELMGEVCSRGILNRKEIFEHIYAVTVKVTNTTEKNTVRLCGNISSSINMFQNPRTKRKHASFKLSVKSRGCRHYIRVTASGELADDIKEIGTGGLVELEGRLQYREYTKEVDGVAYVRGICEVSAGKVQVAAKRQGGI